MKKTWIWIIVAVAIGGFFVFKKVVPTTSPSPTPKVIDFIATFEISTNGTKRTFNNPKYYNLTDYAYISPLDPQYVHLKKTGVTWREFFDSLPMKLTEKCLTTGTGQEFCSNQTKKLRFTLNNLENPTALDMEIVPGAKLLITYE